ncbi:hypothetical protein ACOMHN_029064 [Nucella lapillus]
MAYSSSTPMGQLSDFSEVEDMEVDGIWDKRDDPAERQREDEDLPADWEKMPPGKSMVTVILRPESEEYKAVVSHFLDSFSNADPNILRIFRVQNTFLFKHVSLKFRELQFGRPGEDFKGHMLFHGTMVNNVDSICRKGFDIRLSQRTRYGEGCYFAMKSSYSHSFCTPSDGNQSMPEVLQCALEHSDPNTTPRLRDPNTPALPTPTPSQPRRLRLRILKLNTPEPLQSIDIQSVPIDLSVSPSRAPVYHPQRTNPRHSMFSMLPISYNQSGPMNFSNPVQSYASLAPFQVRPLDLSHNEGPLDLSTVRQPSALAPSGARYMFVSWVLLGRQVRGHSTYRRPPPLHPGDPLGPCFDSCVDQERDPNIAVVFDSHQAYPLFLMEYTCDVF